MVVAALLKGFVLYLRKSLRFATYTPMRRCNVSATRTLSSHEHG